MIYFLQDARSFEIKIGYTGKDDPLERQQDLQVGNPADLVLLGTCPGTRADERRIHEQFASSHSRGEWFLPTPDLLRFIIATVTLARAGWSLGAEAPTQPSPDSPSRRARAELAADWLIQRFRERDVWASTELFAAASEQGISRDAIFEAKRLLDLPRARRNICPDGSACWMWWVPSNWPHLEEIPCELT